MKKLVFRLLSWGLEWWVVIQPQAVGQLLMGWFTIPRTAKAFTFPEGFLKAVEQSFWELKNGQQVAVYDWGGEGPKVLLLHGWESNASRWQTLGGKLLKEGFAPVAIDGPAHGRSSGQKFTVLEYSRWVTEVVQLIKPLAVVGHSAGGMAILVAGEELSAAVPKAVIKGTPAGLESLFDYFRRLVRLGDRSFQTFEGEFEREFGKPYRAFSALDYMQHGMPKGLILHDRGDEVIPEKEAISIAEQWKNAQIEWTQGLGHSQKSPEVDQRIIQFLKEE